MKEYMIGIFVLSAVLGLLSLLLYRGGRESGARFAFGVLLLFTVAMPLSSFSFDILSSLGEGAEYPEFSENGFAETVRTAFEEGIERLIEEEMSRPHGAVTVVADGFSPTEMRADLIRIYLSGAGAFADARRVEAIVEKYGLGECCAEYEI